VQAGRDSHPAQVLMPGSVIVNIHPAWSDPFPAQLTMAYTHHRHHTSSPSRSTRLRSLAAQTGSGGRGPRPPRHHSRWLGVVLLVLTALAVAALLVLAVVLLLVRRRWARLRKSLRVGSSADSVVGAWRWARLRLAADQLPLPAYVTPDALGADGVGDLPRGVVSPLLELAALTTGAAFRAVPSMTPEQAGMAWKLTDDIAREAGVGRSRLDRLRARFVAPPHVVAAG
jgi:hypothetical protein